jgi:hypothetical protein
VTAQKISADYLVIGAGAMGMAFTDVLMTETDATVAMVDRHHQPGGHWNDAYPFVRLHQPSSFYGVNSKKLGSDAIDQTGWNKGLFELATNSEVCAYFDQVMQQQFLPSGRVQFLPMCEHAGDGRVESRVSDASYEITAKKIVDATYMNVTVPSITTPKYEIADGVHCVPVNGLPKVAGQYEKYVIVGAGKTGMDACLFLLKNDVSPDAISWIMPRDSWMLDRATIQPGETFRDGIQKGFIEQLVAIAESTSVEDAFERVSAVGQLLRFDDDVWPTMYRCATVTKAELEQLRRIKNIVRKGRVKRIDANAITLDDGTLDTNSKTLHVDCSADGLERRPIKPVFDGNKITLQSVRTCQQVFSAAFIAHIEAAYDGEDAKNDLCTVVPHPDTHIDFLRTTLGNNLNQLKWGQDAELTAWLAEARLDGFGQAMPSGELDPESQALLDKIMTYGGAALGKLQTYLAEIDAAA